MQSSPLPPIPDRARTTQLVLGSVFTGLGLLLLGLGLVQLLVYWDRTVGGLTIEPIVVPMGLCFSIVGGRFLRRELRRRWLERHGVRAQAVVVACEHTGEVVDKTHVVVRLTLRVEADGRAPYEVTLAWPLGPRDGMRLVTGNRIGVLVSPRSPTWVVPD
ncbi:MAG: hypothetical protein IV100_15585 [Myxococcales bacterium]|nr:hypothetical protein [Myxococcales bacterium]